MASMTHENSAASAQFEEPIKNFIAFCETERAHRRNADPNFDAERFDKAVQLVVDRLAAFKRENLE
jgi:hypothetical protein